MMKPPLGSLKPTSMTNFTYVCPYTYVLILHT